VLVDLAGHTGEYRLPVLNRRPAPIVCTYLGYPNTTGVPGVGYRIVDHLTDPPGAMATEELVRLDGCFVCYQPPADAPDVPVPQRAAPVFGSYNALPKMRPAVVDLWSRILREVPGSRLVLKNAALGAESTRRRVLAAFEACAVPPERLDLLAPETALGGHLAQYGRVDVALDPFPYNGTTTTCEALWMGVPVVTLEGRAHAGRVGLSLLSAVGLGELVARTPDEYLRIAADLAADRPRLAELRRTLRDRVRTSVLTDAGSMARRLEDAYRRMWRRWCATPD
jgi:predicted O-linked N-acetylglucosamine transferase (SPINDLY family)